MFCIVYKMTILQQASLTHVTYIQNVRGIIKAQMYDLGLEDLAASFHMIPFVVVKVLESSIVLVHKSQL